MIAPGSRSTPLALALAGDERFQVHVHHDERAAAFFALGVGLASARPAVLVCTSGTAAAELHPAVVEASLAAVPLLVCTADRPPELQSVGAPQTIDQTHLYGRAVRWFAEPGVADAVTSHTWRSLASRAYAEAVGSPPGPVHLNLAFREPLLGAPGTLPPGRDGGRPWHHQVVYRAPQDPITLPPGRGVIVAGGGISTPGTVWELGERLGWPVLADPRSGCRQPFPVTVSAADALLRHKPFADAHVPDVILRLGAPPASKVVNAWIAGSGAQEIVVSELWVDVEHTAGSVIQADPGSWCRAVRTDEPADASWLRSWTEADARAQAAIDVVLAKHDEPTEPFVARTVATETGSLIVASSMPIRDVEWFAPARLGLSVIANRGANGIDGVVSTAAGFAAGSVRHRVTALVGDIAFLHDSNALLGLADRGLDLTIVVVDNRGGGIFSFLPQASELPAERFEQLFGTPHNVDLPSLAAVHGVPALEVHAADALVPALRAAGSSDGPFVIVVRTDRQQNVVVHEEVHAAVAAAIS